MTQTAFPGTGDPARDALAAAPPQAQARRTVIGLALAGALAAAWIAIHIHGVFHHRWAAVSLITAPLLVVTQCWLSAGLFIVAHDAMHGSLAPGRHGLNKAIGAVILFGYAGFSWKRMRAAHFAHHRAPGGADDPDFHPDDPTAFWPWYASFMRRYFGWPQGLAVCAVVALYLFVFGASYANIVVFYGLPALLSSLQLFAFGTYLPHRHDRAGFDDHHHARSNAYGPLLSLLTCFHFGYHHEHHLAPGEPWWRLPSVRADRLRDRAS